MEYRKLALQALEARKKAYAPYSGFLVGAVLYAKSGVCYTGCNIENAAFTPTNCAERTAFFEAVKNGEREFVAIAVAGSMKSNNPPFSVCTPCGVCLQVMLEFCDPEKFDVILVQDEKDFQVRKLKEFIPYGFRAGDMG